MTTAERLLSLEAQVTDLRKALVQMDSPKSGQTDVMPWTQVGDMYWCVDADVVVDAVVKTTLSNDIDFKP